MQSETLKPCAHCGGSAALDKQRYAYPTHHWVKCGQCGLSTEAFSSPASAIAAWNNRAPTPPADSAGLVERLKYCDEHGIFKAVEDRMSASYDEAAHHIAALDAETARYKGALNRLEKAASDYGMTYLLDECETPELCGIDDAQHVMIVELSDAAREARAALNPETGHD